MTLRLDTPVQYLKGVGPRRAETFQRLGITTVEDLLYHAPHRYLDASTVTPIAKAVVGEEVTLVGRVVSKGVLPTRRRLRIFRAVIQDASGLIECAWPGQAFLDRTINEGQLLLVTGPVKYYHGRQINPKEQIVLAESDENENEDEAKGVVLPVYPATEGLSHRQIRRLIHTHLTALLSLVDEDPKATLPKDLELPPRKDAFRLLHKPASLQEAETARKRLAYEELLEMQLVVAKARRVAKNAPKGIRHELKKELTTQLKTSLPFELTAAQRRAIKEIVGDMTSPQRMNRLLMGDVGSGKTIVALFAMLLAVENDSQAVFMAPTELLAEQHARTFNQFLAPLGIMPELLVGKLSAGEKTAIRSRIKSGASRIILGTHALVQENTGFHRLGLVIIDEQHRFGVEHRASLIAKGEGPDVLLLSATPIPRTLALTAYGDLDISVLKEKPAGRRDVRTTIKSTKSRKNVYSFLQNQCKAGRQAYVVYPIIDESEKVDFRAATTMADQMRVELPELSIGLVHGRLKSSEREEVMRNFRDGSVDILVATTVIEVGIDVPNATVMVIEHPERFGLAQLHQLRGRVGRGGEESYCILLGDGQARSRLEEFSQTNDGFRIAELDLQERGMGQLAGARQSGGIELKFADLGQDTDLISAARQVASDIIDTDPGLSLPGHGDIRKRIERRHERGIMLFGVG